MRSSGRRANEANSYLSSRENGSANAASATGNIAAICALGTRCRMINDTRMALVIPALFAFGIFLLRYARDRRADV